MVLAAIHSREAEYQEIGCLTALSEELEDGFHITGFGPGRIWGF